MMSRKDALRSYRRAYRRAIPFWFSRSHHPTVVLACKRGDRVKRVFTDFFGPEATEWENWPLAALEAMTTQDLQEVERMDREENLDPPF